MSRHFNMRAFQQDTRPKDTLYEITRGGQNCRISPDVYRFLKHTLNVFNSFNIDIPKTNFSQAVSNCFNLFEKKQFLNSTDYTENGNSLKAFEEQKGSMTWSRVKHFPIASDI